MKTFNLKLLNGDDITLIESDQKGNLIVLNEIDKTIILANKRFENGEADKAVLLYKYHSALICAIITVFGNENLNIKAKFKPELIDYLSK